ncbi:Nif3-like dinuclear metal center hexameric protein [Enterobacteriaceae endosymbiont of Plateumaris consimilis]|uniref:Nif3-like dinuclear metal center hexameric protein n=1 Tax=Enterobacteriaceae endosymbiont of Plateumaris consimilis TaxID=2675794 RepID=UPI001449F98F|nr:Nif3-like dinuclear metal center hexameric protein [Enterobacteriaceae endosymbiont of Plateumaris consimilis]QJC28873.1 Nif3-like dinuclear metal center hexameric protein [Enterobacteriaceae endosymbiont of Plateumaris consimilis]
MNNIELEKIINNKLNSININDYVPNGLQIEGKNNITNIITGVSACQSLLNIAVLKKADAIIVHHGYFWKNESLIIKGLKRYRLKTLLSNDINLYSWHIPLDINNNLSNNIFLANLLNINFIGKINPFVFYGSFNPPLHIKDLINIIKCKLNRTPLHFGKNAPKIINNIAWCSGAGQKFFEEIVDFNIEVFLTGEVSEQTIHIATEYGVNFISAGHHATEKGGIIMLSQWLKNNYDLKINFIDINNPV